MRERRQAAVFVAAWLGSIGAVLAAIGATVPGQMNAPSESLTATLAIEGPDWRVEYRTSTGNGTVFLLLQEASSTLGFDLDYVEYGWPYQDVFITAINGTRRGDIAGHDWQYCVNGHYATLGASHQRLQDGDVVLWVYALAGGSELCR